MTEHSNANTRISTSSGELTTAFEQALSVLALREVDYLVRVCQLYLEPGQRLTQPEIALILEGMDARFKQNFPSALNLALRS